MTGGVVQVLCYVRIVGVHYTHRETETDSQVVAQTAQGKERKKPWPPPCSVSTFRPAALRYVYVSSLALGRLWKVSRLADHTRTFGNSLTTPPVERLSSSISFVGHKQKTHTDRTKADLCFMRQLSSLVIN